MGESAGQDGKDVTILIHEGDPGPDQGEPWIVVRLSKSGSAWQTSGEVRCDLSLEDINPDVTTHPGSLRGNMKLRLRDKWDDDEIDSATGMVLSVLAGILFETAKKAKEAGVVDALR